MLRPLKNLVKEKTLARIDLLDGRSVNGFVTYADEDTFEVYTIDSIYNQAIIEETEEGIALEKEEDIELIDFIFIKTVFRTDAIMSIVCDISHKFPIEKTAYIDKMKLSIYDNIEAKGGKKYAKFGKSECGSKGDAL